MEKRNPQETRSVPEPPRRAPELRDGGIRAGHGRAGPPPKLTPGCGFVSYALQPRCAYVCGYGCAFIRVRTGSSLSPGEEQQPPGRPFGDRRPSPTPRAWLPDAATAARAAPPGEGRSGRAGKGGRGAPSPVRTLPPSAAPWAAYSWLCPIASATSSAARDFPSSHSPGPAGGK